MKNHERKINVVKELRVKHLVSFGVLYLLKGNNEVLKPFLSPPPSTGDPQLGLNLWSPILEMFKATPGAKTSELNIPH